MPARPGPLHRRVDARRARCRAPANAGSDRGARSGRGHTPAPRPPVLASADARARSCHHPARQPGPTRGRAQSGGPGCRRLGCARAAEGAIATPLVLAVLAVALAVIGTAAWLTVGPGRELIAGSDAGQPLRPIDGSGPVRVIAVDPVDGHFATLAQAVAEAEPGDRIELYPGIHQAEVVVTKDIEIVGVGDRRTVIVEPLPLAEGEVLTDRLRVLITLQRQRRHPAWLHPARLGQRYRSRHRRRLAHAGGPAHRPGR